MATLTRTPPNQALDSRLDQPASDDGRTVELEQARRAGQKLAVAVSHDLKNPLAVIKGRAQLLQRDLARSETPDRDRLAAGLRQIERTASAMVAMIDELIDVSATQGALATAPDRQPIDLVALARRVAAEYQQLTERHQIRVRATAAAVVGNWDAARLERVVVNLLSNAIKYSPDGGLIDLMVAWDRSASQPWAVLRVRDRGIGIPCADLPRIFEGFHRAPNAVGRASGTGVGLMAVRQIVEQHGGSVSAQSREGRWSKFTVRLPLTPSADTARDPHATARPAPGVALTGG